VKGRKKKENQKEEYESAMQGREGGSP